MECHPGKVHTKFQHPTICSFSPLTIGASHRVGGAGRWGRLIVGVGRSPCLPGEGGDNDPRSCLGSLSVVSAKTPIQPFTTPSVHLELISSNYFLLTKKENGLMVPQNHHLKQPNQPNKLHLAQYMLRGFE